MKRLIGHKEKALTEAQGDRVTKAEQNPALQGVLAESSWSVSTKREISYGLKVLYEPPVESTAVVE